MSSTPNIIMGMPSIAPAILMVKITPITINIAPNIMANSLPVNRSMKDSRLHMARNIKPGKIIPKSPSISYSICILPIFAHLYPIIFLHTTKDKLIPFSFKYVSACNHSYSPSSSCNSLRCLFSCANSFLNAFFASSYFDSAIISV